MEDYIQSTQNPSDSWLYDTGVGDGDTAFIRCPFCGSVFDLDLDSVIVPTTCSNCRRSVKGKLVSR